MAARRFLLVTPLVFSALALASAPAVVRAEDEPDVPNAKYNFIGETTGSVFVRSGPSENYYPTAKLEKGARVKVVGMKFQWLKIEPPAGSFSYVGKAFVDRHRDGTVGRVNNPANVRAGSGLNQMKTTIQTKLDPGAEVKIQGEEDEYFKIEPPAGAYLFVNQEYVRPIRPADNQGIAAGPGANTDAQANAGTASTPAGAASSGATPPAADPRSAEVETATRRSTDALADAAVRDDASTTRPNDAPAPAAAAANPAPREQSAAADGKFEQLEAEFASASQKSVIEQPLGELLGRYQQVTHEDGLPESLKRVADARIAALKVRQEAREQFLATRKAQDEMKQRSHALRAEREELEERIKETHVDFYTAVGTLRPSSLQSGPSGTILYRLTDPQTGRTLVYVRATDRAQIAPLLNQFVGVRGDLQKDSLLRLNVIQPVEVVAVDQERLGNGVTAAMMPPSLLRSMPTVSTDGGNTPIEGQ